MAKRVAEKRYHHGDLRRALIEGAVQIAGCNGTLTFSELAREVGVTPAACYHHFKDRSALLAAAAQVGFERLFVSLRSTRKDDPLSWLRGLTDCYLSFGKRQHAYYRVMFSPDVTGGDHRAVFQTDADACFGELLKCIVEDQPGLGFDEANAIATSIWALLHGIVDLSLAGPLGTRLSEEKESALAYHAAFSLLRSGLSTLSKSP